MFGANKLKEEGNRLASEDKHGEALKKYEEAIEADPHFSQAWHNKGVMYLKLKNYPEAVKSFEKALELDSNYENAKLNLAKALFLQDQHIAAKVVFVNVDLKLTKDNEVKILEFGVGLRSGFSGLEIATGQDVKELLIQELKKLSLTTILTDFPDKEYGDFNRVSSELPERKDEFQLASIVSYSAVCGSTELLPRSLIEKQRILSMDDTTFAFTFSDKIATHEAFVAARLENKARPRTLIFERRYKKELPQEIRSQLNGVKQFVLKAPDREGGEGVVVVEDSDLDRVLRELLEYKNENEKEVKNTLSKEERLIKGWNNSESQYFMVEEYIHGKPVKYNNGHYDATMRVAFLIIRDNGKMQCKPFACYWKLPSKPDNDLGNLRERTVSSFSETRIDAAPVSNADQVIVYQQLQNILPEVAHSMIKRDVLADIEKQAQDTEKQKEHKAYLLGLFSHALFRQGEHRLAMYYFNQTAKLSPNNCVNYHIKGLIYLMRCRDQEAMKNFSEAIEKNPKFAAAYFYRAQVWLSMGDEAKAKDDFRKAKEHDTDCEYKGSVDDLMKEHKKAREPLRKKKLEKLEMDALKKEYKLDDLIKKYELKDDSQSELEKGLRNAAKQESDEDLRIFIFFVKDINAQDAKDEGTALHQAVKAGSSLCVARLLHYEAHTDIKDTDGKIPLDYAKDNTIIAMLGGYLSHSLNYKRK